MAPTLPIPDITNYKINLHSSFLEGTPYYSDTDNYVDIYNILEPAYYFPSVEAKALYPYYNINKYKSANVDRFVQFVQSSIYPWQRWIECFSNNGTKLRLGLKGFFPGGLEPFVLSSNKRNFVDFGANVGYLTLLTGFSLGIQIIRNSSYIQIGNTYFYANDFRNGSVPYTLGVIISAPGGAGSKSIDNRDYGGGGGACGIYILDFTKTKNNRFTIMLGRKGTSQDSGYKEDGVWKTDNDANDGTMIIAGTLTNYNGLITLGGGKGGVYYNNVSNIPTCGKGGEITIGKSTDAITAVSTRDGGSSNPYSESGRSELSTGDKLGSLNFKIPSITRWTATNSNRNGAHGLLSGGIWDDSTVANRDGSYGGGGSTKTATMTTGGSGGDAWCLFFY